MQIKMNLKVFLFLIIFIVTRQIKIYALLMLFALIHELGHLFVGLILGFKPETISMILTGFTIKFKTKCEDYNVKIRNGNVLAVKKAIIALAGPMVNLIIILACLIFYKETQETYLLGLPLELLIYSNILIFAFNILPIYPLDGGRILKELVHIFAGLKNSYTITNKVSNCTVIILTIMGSIFVLIYRNIAIIIILVYLWYITIRENKAFSMKIKAFNIK